MRLECRSRTIAMTACLFGVFSVSVFAYPENPVLHTVENGGDSLAIRTIGDEHYRYTQTEDGILVVSDSTGVYYYADETGAASKFKAKNAGKRSAEAKKFLNGLDRQKAFRKHRDRHPDRFKRGATGRAERPAWVPTADGSSTSTSEVSASGDAPRVLRLPDPRAHSRGNVRIPVLMIENNEARNLDSTEVYNILNKEGFSSNSYRGSVRDYFVDQSTGVFEPVFDLYFVKIENSFKNYIGKENVMIQDAVDVLRSKYASFDASVYDSDNDGEVDALAVLFAGGEVEAYVNNVKKHLGGFQYELRYQGGGWKDGSIDAGNRKKFNNCFIIKQAEYLFPTFVHEFSHTMGLKDHYCVWSDSCYINYRNTSIQAPGAHAWDVMATGMYNGTNSPPNYSAFERNFMGWLKYDSLTVEDWEIVIPPLGSSNFAYKVGIGKNEWYVLENRQKVGWDSPLPNHGMIIWHIDYNQTFWDRDSLNDVPGHQRVDVVEAGDQRVTSYEDGFVSGGGRHMTDDPFPGSQNVTEFGPFASWNGSGVDMHLYSITEKNSNICFATKSGVEVSDCEFVPRSSSSEPESSSSEAALSSSVAATSSEAAVSSSSVRPLSSSGGWKRSSSSQGWLASSSSAVVPMSSTDALLAGTVLHGTRMEISGRLLTVTAATVAPRTLRVFDVQGNMLASETFHGMDKTLDLGAFAGRGTLVVQLIGNGMLEGVLRVSVK